MKRGGVFILIFTLSTALAAQGTWNPRDSVRCSLQNSPGFRLGLDGRYSTIGGHPVRVAGLRIGMDYGKIALYTGYYSTSLSQRLADDTFSMGFGYFSTTLDYSLYKTWRFQVVNSWQIGLGNAYDYRKTNGEVTRNFSGMVIPMETGLSGTVRFLRYFGFSLGFGIRISPINGHGFTGTYYSGGLTFFTGTMYRDCKKVWKKIND